MDKTLVRKRLRGYQLYNEWEQREERRQLPQVTIQESVQQYLELQNLTRRLAPDARQFFFDDNLARHVQTRARQCKALDQSYILEWLRQFAQALERPELIQRYETLLEKTKGRKKHGRSQRSSSKKPKGRTR